MDKTDGTVKLLDGAWEEFIKMTDEEKNRMDISEKDMFFNIAEPILEDADYWYENDLVYKYFDERSKEL